MSKVDLEKNDFDVWVRSESNDCKKGRVKFHNISDLNFTCKRDGAESQSWTTSLHGYILCNEIIEGEVSHPCQYGEKPHRIKVCITEIDNKEIYEEIKKITIKKRSLPKPSKRTFEVMLACASIKEEIKFKTPKTFQKELRRSLKKLSKDITDKTKELLCLIEKGKERGCITNTEKPIKEMKKILLEINKMIEEFEKA